MTKSYTCVLNVGPSCRLRYHDSNVYVNGSLKLLHKGRLQDEHSALFMIFLCFKSVSTLNWCDLQLGYYESHMSTLLRYPN